MDSPIVILECQGRDAVDFLQRQLTADLGALSAACSLGAALLSPKGKVLALMTLCWHSETQVDMLLEPSLVAPMIEYLNRFRFRSDVNFVCSETRQVSITESAERKALDFSKLPTQRTTEQTKIGLAGLCYRIEPEARPDAALNHSQWRAELIKQGLIPFSQHDADRFVPGLLNLDWLGFLSFSKGCYPGQEIVARTRHLGRIKRRLFIAEWISQPQPIRADEAWHHQDGKQAQLICAEHHHGLFLAPIELGDAVVTSDQGAEVRLLNVSYTPA